MERLGTSVYLLRRLFVLMNSNVTVCNITHRFRVKVSEAHVRPREKGTHLLVGPLVRGLGLALDQVRTGGAAREQNDGSPTQAIQPHARQRGVGLEIVTN